MASKQSEYESWQAVAARRGGLSWDRPASFFRSAMPRLDVEIGNARVVGAAEPTYRADPVSTFCARYVAGAGPAFEVYREPAQPEFIASPDLVLGHDEDFDRLYAVHGTSVYALRELFSRRIQAELVKVYARVASNGFEVSLSVPDHRLRTRTLDALVDIVARLASFPAKALDALEHIPGGNWSPARGPWDQRVPPRAVLALPELVEIRPRVIGGVPVMSASVETPADAQPLDQVVDHPIAGQVRITVAHGRLQLLWNHLESEPKKLRAGAELAASFMRSGGGIYR